MRVLRKITEFVTIYHPRVRQNTIILLGIALCGLLGVMPSLDPLKPEIPLDNI
jgi:hypothetical protein